MPNELDDLAKKQKTPEEALQAQDYLTNEIKRQIESLNKVIAIAAENGIEAIITQTECQRMGFPCIVLRVRLYKIL